jgi:hypothetical protein
VCVDTQLFVHMGVYACVVRVGLLGVTVSLENFSRKYLFFIVHSNYAASSNRASVFPVPRICRQYQNWVRRCQSRRGTAPACRPTTDCGSASRRCTSTTTLPSFRGRRGWQRCSIFCRRASGNPASGQPAIPPIFAGATSFAVTPPLGGPQRR